MYSFILSNNFRLRHIQQYYFQLTFADAPQYWIAFLTPGFAHPESFLSGFAHPGLFIFDTFSVA